MPASRDCRRRGNEAQFFQNGDQRLVTSSPTLLDETAMLLPFEAIQCGRSERQQQNDQRERRRKMLQVMRCPIGRVVNKMRGDRQDRAASQRQGPERFSQAELSRFHVQIVRRSRRVSIPSSSGARTFLATFLSAAACSVQVAPANRSVTVVRKLLRTDVQCR